MEKYVLNKLKGCKRVVELYETFKDEMNLYFNMEYMKGGELFDLCSVFGLWSRAEIKYYLYKLILALEEIHEKGIIHRDLKPENVMMNEAKTDLKLVDFATSWDFQNPDMKGSGNGSTGRKIYYHFVGTPQYMPVEFIRNKGSFPASDIYSLGCMFYQFICGFTPFIGPGEWVIFKESTQEGKIKFYNFFTDEEKELIVRMTKLDHGERITIQELKSHPYFKDNLEFYESTVESLDVLHAMRNNQENWLLDLKNSIIEEINLKFKSETKEEESKKEAEVPQNVSEEELTNSGQPKFLEIPNNPLSNSVEEKDKEKIEEKEVKDDGSENEIVNQDQEKEKEDPTKEEKKSLIFTRMKEAQEKIPEGPYSHSFMKSRLVMLKKQIENKLRLKNFEHNF